MPPPKRTTPTQTRTPQAVNTSRFGNTRSGRDSAAWFFPVPSTRITQTYRTGHNAVDVGLPVGSPLIAPTSGKIIRAGWDTSGYGNLVVLETVQGLQVFLAHLNQFAVKPGDVVKRGQLLGYTGNTGNSTGPHLHYEIRQGSGRVDPLTVPYAGQDINYPGPGSASPTSARLSVPVALANKRINPVPRAAQSASTTTAQPGILSPVPTTTAQPGTSSPAPTSSFKTVINGVPVDIPLPKAKLENAIIVIIGGLMIGAGLTGLILSESGKAVLSPVIEQIKQVSQ